ncbi:MAG: TIGR03364 family FAD-dependent oxidoreductase, partial [Planctomycetaceae bacterium]|nr:TIGR03364 family FAD-dependent oxidoreductase [Planctomycetaceae bacterium]
MVWPIGQPAGEFYSVSLRSRDLWRELASLGVLKIEECGSFHLAHRDDELAVLEEFAAKGTHRCELTTASEVTRLSSLANPQDLRGALWSPTELRVDPRTASANIAQWLTNQFEVRTAFGTSIQAIEDHTLIAADDRRWTAERIIVCGGSDLETLYPQVFEKSGLVLCKLQMLRSIPQSQRQSNAPHIASGLTLRHYTSFQGCPSLASLKSRIASETPELDRFGIHVMASPRPDGTIILGDSHEYGDAITPFDKNEIDELMLRELRKVIQLPDWSIQERWHGIYAKHPTQPVFEAPVGDNIYIFTGTGGAGMTMSFGLAEQAWARWTGETR